MEQPLTQSGFIQRQIGTNQASRSYTDDLMKMERLMRQPRLGGLGATLFLILKSRYPHEYNILLTEHMLRPRHTGEAEGGITS